MLKRLSAAAAVLLAAWTIVGPAAPASAAAPQDGPADVVRNPAGDPGAVSQPPPPEPSAIQRASGVQKFSIFMYAVAAASLVWFWWSGLLKRGSLGKPKPPGSPDQPGWAFFVAGFAVYIAASIGAQLAHAVLSGSQNAPVEASKAQAWMVLGSYSVGIPVGLALTALTAGSLRKLFSWRDPLRGVGVLVLIYPLMFTVSEIALRAAALLNPKAPPSLIAHETLRMLHDQPTDPWVLVCAGCAVVGAPVFEEIVYRYFLQHSIAITFGSQWLAVLATAALFASVHMIGGAVPPHAIAALFVLGLALGIAYVKTGRLGVCIALHGAFNLLNVLFVIYGV